ncbi:hypothetical protein J3Q64DRAFT_1717810 [Phycomyces blakesleeanus]|uniref:BLOC-1-related complex subunit 5 n=1 Tax=Phycomyces blakesleeanus TaxID=4837 RepID=A0ABR3B9X6_PHYBL
MGQEQSNEIKASRNDRTRKNPLRQQRPLSELYPADLAIRPEPIRRHSTDARPQILESDTEYTVEAFDSGSDAESSYRDSSGKATPSIIHTHVDDFDDGVVEVVKDSRDFNKEDELIKQLRKIQQFEPFIKEPDRSFSLEGLLGIATEPKETQSIIDPLDHESIADILIRLQKHIDKWMMKISNDQRSLLQRIKYVDDLSAKNTQILVAAYGQAKLASERLNDAKNLKAQAEHAQKQTSNIFQALLSIENHLSPEDRFGHPEFTKRWPELDLLHQRETRIKPPHEVIANQERSAIDLPKVTTTTATDITDTSVPDELGITFAEMTRIPSATIITPTSSSQDKSDVVGLLRTISNSLHTSEQSVSDQVLDSKTDSS